MTRRPDSIQTVTRDTFTERVLEGSGPIVVEFMSYGCAHCRVIEPVLQDVAHEVKDSETIFRLNVATEREIADSYQIESTPTLVMFLDGAEIGRVEGPTPTLARVRSAVIEAFA